MKTKSSSFWHFPADLLALSGIHVVVIAVMSHLLLSFRGWAWVLIYSSALFIALGGAVCLFRAKFPLYQEGRFSTIGSLDLPEPSTTLYRRGWRLIMVGIFLAILLLIQSRMWRAF